MELTQKVVDIFQLDRTAINLSCRCEPGGLPVLIEVHLDIGGDLFFEGLLPRCTSTDILGALIRMLTGSIYQLPEFEIQPAALVFDPGAGAVAVRPYSVVTAETRAELSVLISGLLQNGT